MNQEVDGSRNGVETKFGFGLVCKTWVGPLTVTNFPKTQKIIVFTVLEVFLTVQNNNGITTLFSLQCSKVL
ncbi:hypothetical protein ACIP9X_18990 [Arthrobacter sp. NPDC093125]|uniref:hypothetical protein n=1 Tax=Arthrobacter sp. NPDC093125 TaxID=3363944 RepID=UPI0038066D25